MCGRFTLILEPEAIQQELDLGDFPPDAASRFNIAPSQPVAVVADPVKRNVELFRWGLIPSWAKDPSIGSRMINARSETLHEKPSFRTALARRRCLILADGFYEWHRGDGTSISPSRKSRPRPYYFRLASGKPFAFAGLWDNWHSPDGTEIQTCTIITCAANEHVGQFHDRMPVILDKDSLWQWMDPEAGLSDLQAILAPYPAGLMTSYPVSPMVNSPANDSEKCIAPLVDDEAA